MTYYKTATELGPAGEGDWVGWVDSYIIGDDGFHSERVVPVAEGAIIIEDPRRTIERLIAADPENTRGLRLISGVYLAFRDALELLRLIEDDPCHCDQCKVDGGHLRSCSVHNPDGGAMIHGCDCGNWPDEWEGQAAAGEKP